ncbi:hypothetical protein M0R72_17845 [Candidatus Pacearchaeota archaeon]|jgi:hypothetical protein|nr:hypothetical protein [Candidatus Pacearchaeota archaeon]
MNAECASINAFPANHAEIAAEQPEILPNNHSYWGIMGEVEPVGDGLIRARVSHMEYLVDEALLPQLTSLRGKSVIIGHVAGLWRVGVTSQ